MQRINLFFLLNLFCLTNFAHGESVFRIEIGNDYKNYSEADLRRRIWSLETAVVQLQEKVFELQEKTAQADSWICTVKAMGNIYSATGGSKAVAQARVIEKCSKANDGSFFCKTPKCEK